MYRPDLGNDLPSAHLVDQASADWQYVDQPAGTVADHLFRIVRAEVLRQFVRAELQQDPVENRGDVGVRQARLGDAGHLDQEFATAWQRGRSTVTCATGCTAESMER